MKKKLLIAIALISLLAVQSCNEDLINLVSTPTSGVSSVAAVAATATVSDYGTYTIQCLIGSRFLEVTGNPSYNEKFKNFAKIVQYSATSAGDIWQEWQVIYRTTVNGKKYYELMNLHSGKALDVPGSSTTSGLQLQQYNYNGTNAQLWELRPIGTSGYMNIISLATGLAVTNLNGSTSNGTAIVQQPLGTGNQQNFLFTPITADTYRDDDVCRFFDRNNTALGSVAFDEGTSIPLTWSGNNGKVLWVTQDAWDGPSLQSNMMFNCSDYFRYNNSIFIQQSKTNWAATSPNMTINSPMGRPRQICSNQAGTDWSWPGPGVEIGDKVYLHCGEGVGLSATNQSLYVLTQNTGTLWTVARTTPAGMSGQTAINYSAGMVKAADNYVYSFGCQGTGFGYSSNIHVARFPVSNPQAWTFWNGSSWTNSPTTGTAARITDALAASGVSYCNGKYVLVTIDCGFNCDNTRNVYVSTSTSPTGPFTSRVQVYKIKEYFYGQYARYYTPAIHPEFTNGRNELLITYCLNFSACGLDACQGGYLDPYYYRVKGIRVPYSKIGL